MSETQDNAISSEALIEDIHVRELTTLLSPEEVKTAYPASEPSIATVNAGREAVRAILGGSDPHERLVAIVGPCSVHDPEAAVEYASWLKGMRQEHSEQLEILMRMYFEKPRTTVGWKGLINDPRLDESYDINAGLLKARGLAVDITSSGVPVGTELLDTMTPQYFAGLISWGAIGARTTESQLHRELASGLSFPIGFKNGTSGSIKVAADAVSAATRPHHFLAITNEGRAAIASTSGNPDCHIVLRGGNDGPNYSETNVQEATAVLEASFLKPVVMIDASHANSGKDHTNQSKVIEEVARQIKLGSTAIIGVMIESNLREGSQPFKPGGPHEYGKSITDGCAGLDETADMLGRLAAAVKAREHHG